jgi:hypothetical protein
MCTKDNLGSRREADSPDVADPSPRTAKTASTWSETYRDHRHVPNHPLHSTNRCIVLRRSGAVTIAFTSVSIGHAEPASTQTEWSKAGMHFGSLPATTPSEASCDKWNHQHATPHPLHAPELESRDERREQRGRCPAKWKLAVAPGGSSGAFDYTLETVSMCPSHTYLYLYARTESPYYASR